MGNEVKCLLLGLVFLGVFAGCSGKDDGAPPPPRVQSLPASPSSTPAPVPAPVPAPAPAPATSVPTPTGTPPADSPADAGAKKAPEAVAVYRTRTGKKYHRAGCRYLSKSCIPISLEDAARTLGPCSVCRPPVPQK